MHSQNTEKKKAVCKEIERQHISKRHNKVFLRTIQSAAILQGNKYQENLQKLCSHKHF